MSIRPTDCERAREDLSALQDGELAPEREAWMRAHLAGCADCRARLASLERVDPWLARVPLPEVGAEQFERVRARIAAEDAAGAARDAGARSAPPPRRRRRVHGLVAAAVAAAAALALYLALPRPRAPGAPAPEPRVARAPEPLAEPTRDPEFDALPAEEIAVGLELDTAQDLEVIANLELLEALVALEEGRS